MVRNKSRNAGNWITLDDFEKNVWRLIEDARRNSFFFRLRDLAVFKMTLKKLIVKWERFVFDGYIKRPLPLVEVINNDSIIQYWNIPNKKRICMNYPEEWITIQRQGEAIELKNEVCNLECLKRMGDFGGVDRKDPFFMDEIYKWIWENYERIPRLKKNKEMMKRMNKEKK